MSMEFLMGRSLTNALNNIGVVDEVHPLPTAQLFKIEDVVKSSNNYVELQQALKRRFERWWTLMEIDCENSVGTINVFNVSDKRNQLMGI